MPATPERNSSPIPLQLQATSITLLDDVLHLQEEMNNVMVHLLTLRASVDACQWRLISETEIAHHQNETKTSEAIKEVKAHYMATLSDDEAAYVAAIREAEATHSASAREADACTTAVREAEVIHATALREVEVICATAVREAEAASVVQTSKLQQIHHETMQTLEDEANDEEKHACQSFLWACGVATPGLSYRGSRGTYVPYNLLTGNMSSNSCSATDYQVKGSHPLTFLPQEACHHYILYWD